MPSFGKGSKKSLWDDQKRFFRGSSRPASTLLQKERGPTLSTENDFSIADKWLYCGWELINSVWGMEEILNLIPHRPPFLFVDKIIEVTDEGAKASRLVRADEPQFIGHYPNNPIMPGVLLCEAVFQTAAIYLVKKMEKAGESVLEKTPVLSRIGETKFKQIVRPGDEIVMEVKMVETLSKFHFLKGTIKKADKLVMTTEFALALVD